MQTFKKYAQNVLYAIPMAVIFVVTRFRKVKDVGSRIGSKK